MDQFLENHQCSRACQAIHIPPLVRIDWNQVQLDEKEENLCPPEDQDTQFVDPDIVVPDLPQVNIGEFQPILSRGVCAIKSFETSEVFHNLYFLHYF